MTILNYNEEQLARELARLAAPLRAAFAAACAERLKPAYDEFSKQTARVNPVQLSSILGRLWEDLDGNEMSSPQLQESIESAMELIPQGDDGPWVLTQAAEDAAAALAYALRCRQTGEAQEAAWAARRAYEAVDHFVIDREKIDVNEAGSERAVLLHPIVQVELSRQRRDLDAVSLSRLGARAHCALTRTDKEARGDCHERHLAHVHLRQQRQPDQAPR